LFAVADAAPSVGGESIDIIRSLDADYEKIAVRSMV
jgi:hypothetical protein